MNWKTVVHLMRVDMKSGRLIRGRRLTKYRENKLVTYLLYIGALALGLAVGIAAGLFFNTAARINEQLYVAFHQGLVSLFLTLPTLVLIYSLVFTMMQQIQRSGMKLSVEAQYWLPITWEEHTLASTLAVLLGFPLISIIFIGSAIITLSVFTGQVVYAIASFFGMLASAFSASLVTEIFRILQVRFIGAVYKSSGRAAVWVRFVGSLLFILVFYIVYFFVTSGTGALVFVQLVASGQSSVWFIPFVWLGMAIYSVMNGLTFQALAFLALSIMFIAGLFYMAVVFNRRFGLYEPPAITVQRGVYAPKTGFLGRLGYSTPEAALIRKDLKAFTRRRELMYIFVLPILFILVPVMQTFSGAGNGPPGQVLLPLFATIFVLPSAVAAAFLGNVMIGEEGSAMWRIYASPISAKSLVKSKYSIVIFVSIIIIAITGTVGMAIFHPSIRAASVAVAESFLLMIALGAVSLSNGIKGADFTELPRPRMIRPVWAILNLILCFMIALVILAPIVLYALKLPMLTIDLYPAVTESVIIDVIVTFVAYRMALRNAKQLLAKAEI